MVDSEGHQARSTILIVTGILALGMGLASTFIVVPWSTEPLNVPASDYVASLVLSASGILLVILGFLARRRPERDPFDTASKAK